jgi:hypothetical protein
MALAAALALAVSGVFGGPVIWPRIKSVAGGFVAAFSTPLAIAEVDSVLSRDGDLLAVSGTISNPGDEARALPALEIAVQSDAQEVLASSTHAPPRPVLGPGEAVRFEVRVPSPPPEGRQVRVQFTRSGLAVASRFLRDGSP